MGLLGKLFGRSRAGNDIPGPGGADAFERLSVDENAPHEFRRSGDTATRQQAEQTLAAVTAPAEDGVNIWDLEGQNPVEAATAGRTAPSIPDRPEPSPARKRRNRTRLLGFEHSDGQVVDLFEGSAEPVIPNSARFPVGWVIVLEGPGRGESFTLHTGMSPIGRGEDQTVQLDFGDNAISRSGHAAIVYDPEELKFFLGQGGKSNIVRLNGKVVISNEPLVHMDKIVLGETTLQFIALCDENFNWNEKKDSEAENVEIA